MMTSISPFDHLREMLRVHSLPLRIAVVRVLLEQATMVYSAADRERMTRMLVQLLDDIAEDHR